MEHVIRTAAKVGCGSAFEKVVVLGHGRWPESCNYTHAPTHIMRFSEWLFRLSRPIQYVNSVIALLISAWAWMHGWIWPWGWIFGFGLLCYSCFVPQSQRDDDRSDWE